MTAPELSDVLLFLGLDPPEAAQLLGVSLRTLQRWLAGEEIPGPAAAALKAWHQLHALHLAWKPDAISVFENDQAQIERARQHAQEVAYLINLVEKRGGPKFRFSVSIAKGLATFGPFEVGFYSLANGGFSFSSYRRRDTSPDLARDKPFLEDAAYCISKAFSQAKTAPPALRAVARYVRQHSDVFVVDGPGRQPTTERRRIQQEIEGVADKLIELATAAETGDASYHQFEELLQKLHALGFFPTIELVSAVAHAMV
ncbi:helix-turn-helix domain-containing protein [Bradyrhizobium iriomotense]|uniref:helix-turn-helix domain-containing protein n=1 Tax=Bradyrhizobium iriomotense TaxID=441950 RepID=UPI001B8A718B|nr:helix-turn-helix domain-containing protein [Bradyrhizobium iriomotense]MBR1130768.1 helix-turn-helix domain-containing protein [Bradyrhizobium iriomotense]